MRYAILRVSCVGLALAAFHADQAHAACCYFSAKNADVLQQAQKGNALDFGMVIPTPSQPKLHEMPRDFFKHLAVYTIMKGRWWVYSKLPIAQSAPPEEGGPGNLVSSTKPRTVTVLEAGVVGSLDYKIIEATRADDLFQWLKDNKYSYSGDEALLAGWL